MLECLTDHQFLIRKFRSERERFEITVFPERFENGLQLFRIVVSVFLGDLIILRYFALLLGFCQQITLETGVGDVQDSGNHVLVGFPH